MTQKEYISQLLNTNIPYETTVGEYVRTLEQHIAELEMQLADANSYFDGIHTELEITKTCSGCRYLIENSIVRCRKEVSIGIPFSSKEDWFMFGCNRYEPKEIK